MSDLTTTTDEAYARGYQRGYDVATSRAESRRRLGLPIEAPEPHLEPTLTGYDYPEPIGRDDGR